MSWQSLFGMVHRHWKSKREAIRQCFHFEWRLFCQRYDINGGSRQSYRTRLTPYLKPIDGFIRSRPEMCALYN